MKNINTRVCPVALSGSLDNSIRRWLQNPEKILRPYITEGMTALDVGCGPGFFYIEMAPMVSKTGQGIVADLQGKKGNRSAALIDIFGFKQMISQIHNKAL